jgi:protein gp37
VTKNATAIGWTWNVASTGDFTRGYTFNPWIGCTKVASECAFCYADIVAKDKMGRNLWGKNALRMFMGPAYWQRLGKLSRLSGSLGHSIKVFAGSMCDLFEILCPGHPDTVRMDTARQLMFTEIDKNPDLTFILCTKRPFNIMSLVPAHWQKAFPSNVWVLV